MPNLTSGANNIEEILVDLGYTLTKDGDGWRARPIYRDSSNDTSLKVYENGNFCDFSAGIRGTFTELVRLTKNLDSIDKAREYLNSKDYQYSAPNKSIEEPIIRKEYKIFSPEITNELKQDYSYWNKRGISDDVLKLNTGGVYKGRYWFLIYNSKGEIIGKTGRDLTGKSKIKWLHKGKRNSWVYNAYLNSKTIQEKKEVIIVESPGDYLSLAECGINNVLVLFGVEMSLSILNYLLRINVNKIYLSLNDDKENNLVGNLACEKLARRLNKYFDYHQIMLKNNFFGCNDLNELLLDKGKGKVIGWVNT